MVDNLAVGKHIEKFRKAKGLTGEKLAELLNVSPQAVSKWENGRCLPETSSLPLISEILGISIDKLLIPQELVIVSAIFSDGKNFVNITKVLNDLVNGNSLNVYLSSQMFGTFIRDERLGVVLIEYQTAHGEFCTYALENTFISINTDTKGFEKKSEIEILGAYYGTKTEFRDCMNKIKHYDYFNWKDIYVNHETFPSLPGTDETEYLTIIYINNKGIHAVSASEGEVLTYKNGEELLLKDTTTCILPGIMTLEWGQGMDCPWAGAVYAALKYMGESYSYEDIMGISGACYRFAFCDVWDWSATDALVAFDYSEILFNSIGYKQIWANRLEKSDRSEERKKIILDIANNKPVLAINLRIGAEWGVITGYSENGKTLYCRTYFDSEYLNENKDYLETDFWPFLIMHFGEKREKLSEKEILIESLKTLVNSFEAKSERGYFQGEQGYEKWIEGLENESLWIENCLKEDIGRRLGVNDSMLLNLIDARRCASKYLAGCDALLSDEKTLKLKEIAASYKEITKILSNFRDKLKTIKGDIIKYNMIETKGNSNISVRKEQIDILRSVLSLEKEIVKKVKEILYQ